MCNIIHALRRDYITKGAIKTSWERNSHGAGIVFETKEGWSYYKGLMTLEEVYDALREIPGDAETAVHLRYATHGNKTADMTHPFIFKDSRGVARALMHNGTLDLEDKTRPGMSDSAILAEMLENKSMAEVDKWLNILPGRYALTTDDGIMLYGNWEEREKTLQSSPPYKPIKAYPKMDKGKSIFLSAEHQEAQDWINAGYGYYRYERSGG